MKYFVLGMLCLLAIIAYTQKLAFGICEEQIRESLVFDKKQIGSILGAWQLGYALFQLPSGWLADRWGSRRSLLLFVVTWTFFLGLAAYCNTYGQMITVWSCMGIAQAGIFPCSTKIIGEWFATEKRATASGLLGSSMGLGTALSPLIATRLLADFGLSWQDIFLMYVVPGWLWAVVFAIGFRRNRFDVTTDARPGSEQYRDAVMPRDSSGGKVVQNVAGHRGVSWVVLLTCVPLWLLCAQQFFRAAAMMFFQTWFPTFLRETRGVDLVQSGNLAFFVGFGGFLGGLSGGMFSDWVLVKTGKRRLARQGIAVFGMLSCAALIGVSYLISDHRLAILCIAIGAFLAFFGGVSGYTLAIELGGRDVAKTFALMNMMGNLGAAMFPWVVGYIVEWDKTWSSVLFLCVLILVIDAFCWAILNPVKTVSGEPLKYA